MSEKLQQALELLSQISEDRTVPRNIRDNAKKAKDNLESDEEITIKIDKALQLLDEASDDPNVPVYTRTQIWSISTLLESVLKQ